MDVHLARRWAQDGLLPNFAGVLSTWPSLPTENPLGLIVGGLWPSFWSRSGVGHHGSYSYRQLVPGTYTTERFTPADIDVRPFWLDLDDAGQRCVIFDVPLVRPTPLQHGVHIVDWGSHDCQLDTTITDPDVAERFATLEPYPQRSCDAVVRGHPDGHEQLFRALLAGVRQRREAISLLLDNDVDLFAAVFSESHCAGHQFFHLHDPQFPGHEPALVQRLGGDPVLAVYRALDHALGELLRTIPDDSPIMVLLSHGFGPHYDGSSMLNTILQRIEARHRPLTGLSRWRRVLPARMRGASRRLRRHFRPNPRERSYIDETRAWFTMPNNDLYGAIRLNLRGREPHGRLRPGDDVEAAVELLTNELMSITHQESGAPAVRRVIRVDGVHAGPRRNMLPDLCVEWNWSEPFRVLTSPTIGVLTAEVRPGRTGDHRPHGAVFTRHLTLPDHRSVRVEDLAGLLVDDVLTTQASGSATPQRDGRRG